MDDHLGSMNALFTKSELAWTPAIGDKCKFLGESMGSRFVVRDERSGYSGVGGGVGVSGDGGYTYGTGGAGW